MRNAKNRPVYVQVAERVCQYPYGAGRAQIAADFGITKSTAQTHLDKCVRLGTLGRFYGWLNDRSRGWVYIDPETRIEMMFGLMDDPDETDDHEMDNLIAAENESDHQEAAYIADQIYDDLPF